MSLSSLVYSMKLGVPNNKIGLSVFRGGVFCIKTYQIGIVSVFFKFLGFE